MSKRKHSQVSSTVLLPEPRVVPGLVLLVASRDEPTGIADDWFFQRALRSATDVIRSESVLWDDMPSEWMDRSVRKAGGMVPLVRSLWEGRDRRHGTTAALAQFYAQAAVACPPMKADYALLDWITHKKYLLELRAAGVPVVPTMLLADNCVACSSNDLMSIDQINVQEVSHGVSPGDVKRLLEKSGWDDAILKPAVGTRGEGVLRIRLGDWGLATANDIQRLLSAGDCLLQPFLPSICCDQVLPSDLKEGSTVTPTRASLWGEICVVFVDGIIVHAIHKNPALWGWHRASCDCSGEGSALQGAECTCDGGAMAECVDRNQAPSALSSSPAVAVPPPDITAVLNRAQVEGLSLPLPEAIVRTATAAIHALPGFRVASNTATSADLSYPLLCRVDLLPRIKHRMDSVNNSSVAEIEWLVSEVEGQWCECFFRAAPPETPSILIDALSRRMQMS